MVHKWPDVSLGKPSREETCFNMSVKSPEYKRLRAKRVKAKLLSRRLKKEQTKKIENETRKLKLEIEKLSNKGHTIRNAERNLSKEAIIQP